MGMGTIKPKCGNGKKVTAARKMKPEVFRGPSAYFFISWRPELDSQGQSVVSPIHGSKARVVFCLFAPLKISTLLSVVWETETVAQFEIKFKRFFSFGLRPQIRSGLSAVSCHPMLCKQIRRQKRKWEFNFHSPSCRKQRKKRMLSRLFSRW